MIGRIRGILIEKQPTDIQVEVAGIAYEVQVPMSTLFKLPEVGDAVTLHTHLSCVKMRSSYSASLN